MLYLNIKEKIAAIVSLALASVIFVNIVLPERPRRDIDTKTLIKKDGFITTKTPHLPVLDFSNDGRIGLLKKGINNKIPFIVLRPENVKDHLKNIENNRVGINMMGANINTSISKKTIKNQFSKNKLLEGYLSGRSILCEKDQKYQNPRVCNHDRDCYTITIITRFSKKVSSSPDKYLFRLVAVDANIQVEHPKTPKARIAKIELYSKTKRIGPALGPFPKLAEIVTSGHGRLLVTRVGGADLVVPNKKDTDSMYTVKNANLAYSVYDESTKNQCDPSKWTKLLPLAYAPHDIGNNMKERFKFARYPFRDTMNNTIPWNGVIGGSYPWIDKEAANLFITTYGKDDPYYNDSFTTPYTEHGDSFKPGNKSDIDAVEKTNANTAGISLLGFWSHGKLIQVDGLLNNADYNFRISNENYSMSQLTRNFKIYSANKRDKGYELLGRVRERSVGKSSKDKYNLRMTTNSSYMGSLENRLTYVEQMKPVTPRDVVWFFSTTRHSEELVFDDFINPHIVINAEMNGAVGYLSESSTMRHYDGIYRGKVQDQQTNFIRTPKDSDNFLAFQNSASSIPGYQNNPQYGLPIGNVRLEPIAKGGVHGKGVWLTEKSGIKFLIPDQKDYKRNLSKIKDLYIGVNIDSRTKTNEGGDSRLLFSLEGVAKIYLTRSSSKNISFDGIEIKNSKNKKVYHLSFSSGLEVRNREWRHIALQFSSGNPKLYLDGLYAGTLKQASPGLDLSVKLQPNKEVILGSIGDGIKGIRGWFDDFKVIAANPTVVEKCNYARGTVIKTTKSSSQGYWRKFSSYYPDITHKEIHYMITNGIVAGNLNKGSLASAKLISLENDTRYACFNKNNDPSMMHPYSVEKPAQLKELPGNSESVRNSLTHGFLKLSYSKPRPDFSSNKFCTSCHIPQSTPSSSYTSYPELDIRALTRNSEINAAKDPRRQPLQPPSRIHGIIPKGYFGKGKPKKNILTGRDAITSYIDYWILPKK